MFTSNPHFGVKVLRIFKFSVCGFSLAINVTLVLGHKTDYTPTICICWDKK